jgi:hypothetical protein
MSLPLLNGIPFLGGISLIQDGHFYDGSAASPTISFASDPELGFFKGGSNLLGFAVAGVQSLRLTGSGGTGNIYGGTVDNHIDLLAAGAITLIAAGTNQNIQLIATGSGACVFDAANHIFRSQSGGTEFGRFNNVGALLIGTATDSGNGRIQLATHTTGAGGIGFGTDTNLFRSAAGGFVFNASAGTYSGLQLALGGATKAQFVASAGNTYLDYDGSLILRNVPGAYAVALTIDATQGATFTAKVVSTNATAGIGYATGAGTQVTQTTSKATAVSSNKVCGKITTHNASLAGNTNVAFTFNNTAIAATDLLVIQHVNGGTMGAYVVRADCAAGSATITIRNTTATPLGEAIALRFALIKATEA